jgi:hypothetical protein
MGRSYLLTLSSCLASPDLTSPHLTSPNLYLSTCTTLVLVKSSLSLLSSNCQSLYPFIVPPPPYSFHAYPGLQHGHHGLCCLLYFAIPGTLKHLNQPRNIPHLYSFTSHDLGIHNGLQLRHATFIKNQENLLSPTFQFTVVSILFLSLRLTRSTALLVKR